MQERQLLITTSSLTIKSRFVKPDILPHETFCRQSLQVRPSGVKGSSMTLMLHWLVKTIYALRQTPDLTLTLLLLTNQELLFVPVRLFSGRCTSHPNSCSRIQWYTMDPFCWPRASVEFYSGRTKGGRGEGVG